MISKMNKVILFLIISIYSVIASAESLLNLSEGDAATVPVDTEIDSVFISDPAIADYQVIDKNKVVIFGKKIGHTNLFIFDNEGNELANRKVIVNKSLSEIKQYISIKFPDANIDIFNFGEQVVLSGTVSNEQVKDEINNIVGTLLSKKSNDFNFNLETDDQDYEVQFMKQKHFTGLVNNIEVLATRQVNVKLSIAEVSHSFLEQIGVQYNSIGHAPGVFVNPLTNFSASDILSVITAIGNDGIGQVLAEPNLSVISGESASFLVGGELPVVTIVDNGTNVTYKEFGVKLELLAKVRKDNKITLSLMPEVSSLDTQYSNDKYDLPALKTRRARTTVELGDGQSFVLGGLLSTEDKERLNKVPYIGDIPVLGALFRNSRTERNKTELIIVATVNLVQPIHPSQVQLPTIRKTTTLDRFFALDSNYESANDKWANEILATGGFKK
ncbi:type II and III secretion system protein family protein [Photobacterium damselae]|uniref:type II and III secretion system protein family protein n=1 Tax=Photobacterium damselae TaxID=38293 RepID=UPI0030F3909E